MIRRDPAETPFTESRCAPVVIGRLGMLPLRNNARPPRMPLAVLRKQVKDLPLTFTLDGTIIRTNAATIFDHSACADVKTGVKAGAAGVKQSDGSIVAAHVRVGDPPSGPPDGQQPPPPGGPDSEAGQPVSHQMKNEVPQPTAGMFTS